MAPIPKWKEKHYIDTLKRARDWFIEHEEAIYFKEYFIDWKRPDIKKDMPWETLRKSYSKHESAINLWNDVTSMQEKRIISWVVSGKMRSAAFGQFLLRCKHDYVFVEKQQVEVTNNELKFNFGNTPDANTETDV